MRFKKMKPVATNLGVHPFVKWAWAEMDRQRITQEAVSRRTGLSAATLRNWGRGRSSPKLQDLEMVLNVLGGTITISPDSRFAIKGAVT